MRWACGKCSKKLFSVLRLGLATRQIADCRRQIVEVGNRGMAVGKVASLAPGFKNEIEAGSVREGPEVPVSGEERNASVNTGLGY